MCGAHGVGSFIINASKREDLKTHLHMRININVGIGSDVCGFYEIQLAIVLTTSEGKVVLKDVMLTGQRPVSRISQFHLMRLLNQNYPRPPCALAEKFTETTMRAWFLQIKKISYE